MAQAERNLSLAEKLRDMGFYEWSCFLAHQAAELAVKALFQRLGAEAWGHSIAGLLEELPEPHRPGAELLDHAKELDKAYIPTRYPNAHQRGAPFQLYTHGEAERLVRYARQIIEFCKGEISKA